MTEREPEDEPQSLSLRAWSTSDPKPKGGNARMWSTTKPVPPVPKKRKPKKRTKRG